MNCSGSGFRYRKIENNMQLKNSYCFSSFQNQNQLNKQTIFSLNTNSYTGKNYSSIKSLIRRLQASGQARINYPRIKGRNQRADIFLRGGSINHMKKAQVLQQRKTVEKKQCQTKKRKMVEGYNSNNRLQEIQEVYICRNIPLENNRQQVQGSSQTFKTQIQKPIPLNSIAKTIDKKYIVDTPNLQNFDAKYNRFVQKRRPSQKRLCETSKIERKKDLTSLEQMDQISTRVEKRNISTNHPNKMHPNMSQNSIPSYKTQTRTIKITRSITNSMNEVKKPVQICDIKKPLFYLTQDELKYLNLSSKSFIVLEYPSKQIITGTYFRQVAEIASLTKIITFYCCLLIVDKYQLNIDKQILVIDQQVQQTTGTSAELQEGDIFTFRQICYGLMLPSGNDAALAMAKWGGKLLKIHQNNETESNLKVFMSYMNATCLQIGMKSSYFGNPHGLPHAKSGSTVEDVATVIYEALKNPFFRQVVRTKSYRCWIENNGIKREVIWQNTNKLLRRSGFIGVKTGVTVTAGPCLSTCYETGDKILIIVLLKASKLSRRFKETRRILGKVLGKLDYNLYKREIKQIERNDVELDSDNSEQEQEFNYDRNDAQQMRKRLKIITHQM